QALNDIGLRSRFDSGFDRSLVNLSLGQEIRDLFRDAPLLADAWREHRRAVDMARAFYLEHNAHLITLFRRTLTHARQVDTSLTLARLVPEDGRGHEGRPLVRYALGREIQQALRTLEANDDHLVDLLRETEHRASPPPPA